MIETLNDDSQILLLYLADELPEHDRRAVEQRLSSEAALSSELEQLRSVYGEIGAKLQDADALSTLPVNASATARSIGRLMRQRLAEPRPTIAPKKLPSRSRLRPWLIPSAAAAAILVASALWINRGSLFDPHKEVVVNNVGPTTTTTHPASQASDETLELFQDSFTPPSRDIADALNAGSPQKELSSMQDDVSPYLLKIGTVQE